MPCFSEECKQAIREREKALRNFVRNSAIPNLINANDLLHMPNLFRNDPKVSLSSKTFELDFS